MWKQGAGQQEHQFQLVHPLAFRVIKAHLTMSCPDPQSLEAPCKTPNKVSAKEDAICIPSHPRCYRERKVWKEFACWNACEGLTLFLLLLSTTDRTQVVHESTCVVASFISHPIATFLPAWEQLNQQHGIHMMEVFAAIKIFTSQVWELMLIILAPRSSGGGTEGRGLW